MARSFDFDLPANQCIDIAAQAIDRALSQSAYLSGAEATKELHDLQQLQAKIESYKIALVARVQRTEVWRDDSGNTTAAAYLKRELNIDQREVQSELRITEAFEEFPQLEEALRTGRIRRTAVDLILSICLRTLQRRQALPRFIDQFIKCAEVAPLSRLRQILAAWADQIDPVATGVDEDGAVSRRYLHVSELTDGVKVDGFFDKVAGMKIIAAINAAFTALYKETHREGELIEQGASPSDTDAQVRSSQPNSSPNNLGETPHPERPLLDFSALSAKQRADAFIKFLIEPACDGRVLPTSGGFTPNVIVTVSMDRLESTQIAPQRVHQAVRNAVDSGNIRELELNSTFIETTNGPGRSILGHASTMRLTCDANVQRIVLSPESVPLDIGRTTRVIPPHIRRALALRDGGCQFPYCERPVAWCEAHHIQHWSKGGATEINNLVMLCSRHHHEVHSQGHEIHMDSLGKPRVLLKHTYSSLE